MIMMEFQDNTSFFDGLSQVRGSVSEPEARIVNLFEEKLIQSSQKDDS